MNRKTAVCTGIMTGVGEDDPRMLTHGTEVQWEQGSYTQQSSILQMYPNQGIKLARDPDEIYFLPKISNMQQIRGRKCQSLAFYTSAVLDLSNISNAEEEKTVLFWHATKQCENGDWTLKTPLRKTW